MESAAESCGVSASVALWRRSSIIHSTWIFQAVLRRGWWRRGFYPCGSGVITAWDLWSVCVQMKLLHSLRLCLSFDPSIKACWPADPVPLAPAAHTQHACTGFPQSHSLNYFHSWINNMRRLCFTALLWQFTSSITEVNKYIK